MKRRLLSPQLGLFSLVMNNYHSCPKWALFKVHEQLTLVPEVGRLFTVREHEHLCPRLGVCSPCVNIEHLCPRLGVTLV